MKQIEDVARVCHEANRAIQVALGESDISPHYDNAPDWQKDSAYEGVVNALNGMTPEQLHLSWCNEKRMRGWVYGDVKDPEKKTHPCLVPYSLLHPNQKLKDYVFQAIVQGFKDSAKDMTYQEWLDQSLTRKRNPGETLF